MNRPFTSNPKAASLSLSSGGFLSWYFFAVLVLLTARLQADPAPAAGAPITLQSSQWEVIVSSVSGGITKISDPKDTNKMNWVHDQRPWGIVRCRLGNDIVTFDQPVSVNAKNTRCCDSTYHSTRLQVVVHRVLDSAGTLTESFAITNTSDNTVSLPQGAISITVPFNDSYNDGAPKCLTHNCNAHLWAGGNSSWANAIRMGGEGPDLGLVLNQGSLGNYCILEGASTNDRGDLAFNPLTVQLGTGETYTVSWTLFWHQDWNDFWAFLQTQTRFIRLQAQHYTVIQGEPIEIRAQSTSSLEAASLTLNGAPVAVQHSDGQLTARIKTDHSGEYLFDLENKGQHTWLRANAIINPMDLLKARVKFIVEKQQKNTLGDPLDGAFVPYDNQTEAQFCNQDRSNNHNEGRERVAMGVLVALYIPLCQDTEFRKKLLNSLSRYETFLERELQDDKGMVYDQAGYIDSSRRYNTPWIAHVHLAAYLATNDQKYLELFLKTFHAYYNSQDGANYYMIGIQMLDGLKALQDAGLVSGYGELLKDFRRHADVIADRGGNYPTSEVNYEQSIVGPGVQIELEMYLATHDQKYLDSAKQQLVYLEAFNGQQPDYHQYDLGIRHWDDYWFGKLGLFGDTFPHYWTTITAVAFDEYATATNDGHYRDRARDIMLANMCLFTPEGRGSCAFVYPATLDGNSGYQFDPWANDQDWALVNWLTINNRHH